MLKPAKILTLKKVLEVEEHGLSINKSAYLLGVSMPKLWRFIKKNNIPWSGKNPCFRKNEVNPDSTLQQIKRSGICKGTIYYRINVMGLTLEQALAMGSIKMMPKKLTLEKVLEVEAHGLSIGKSAYLLDVAVTTLARFIRDNRIVWRGKKRFGYNPYSNNAIIVQSGIPSSTVYGRMASGLTLHEALNHKTGDL